MSEMLADCAANRKSTKKK